MALRDLIPRSSVSDVCLWINHNSIELTEHQYDWKNFKNKSATNRKVFELSNSTLFVDCLKEIQSVLLKSAEYSKLRGKVIFSNYYNRYVLMPWNSSLTTNQEKRAYAKLLMEEHFGNIATTWRLGINTISFQSPTLISGIGHKLIDDIEALFKSSNIPLIFVSPLQILAINHAIEYLKRNRLESDCWLFSIESHQLVLSLLVKGKCVLIQNFAVDMNVENQMWLVLQRAKIISGYKNNVPILRFGFVKQHLSEFRISQISPKRLHDRPSQSHFNEILS